MSETVKTVKSIYGSPIEDTEARSAASANAQEIGKLSDDKADKYELLEVKIEAKQSDIIDNKFVDSNGIENGSVGCVCTHPIQLYYEQGTPIEINCSILAKIGLVFLGTDYEVVLGIDGTNASMYGITPTSGMQTVIVAVPAGAKYIRVSAYKSVATGNPVLYTKPSDIWIKGSSKMSIADKINQNTRAIEEGGDYLYNVDHLYGKRLAVCGDSITEATNPAGGYFKNYAEIVAERHKMFYYMDGSGGSTMANTEGHNPFCVSRYLKVPADFDILTIWFGWNDATYSQIGTIEDTEDTTFYGAYKKVLDYFIATYPTKKIGLIVPYGNSSVEPFRNAVRELSDMYGVPCLDLVDGKQCSLLWGTANAAQEARRAALTYDSTHPNQAGHEYLSTMYEEFIKRL